jgi:hypothetical protein
MRQQKQEFCRKASYRTKKALPYEVLLYKISAFAKASHENIRPQEAKPL